MLGVDASFWLVYAISMRFASLMLFCAALALAYGDEIGLHIHPYGNFIDTTPVPCRTEPSLAYAAGDPTGSRTSINS